MIAIVDYDTSRTANLKKALDDLGAESILVNSVDRLERAAKIILPACDSFPKAVRSMRDRGMLRPIFHAVDAGRPVLGIGQGMHLLFDVSYEEGQHTGLGLVHGKVAPFSAPGYTPLGSGNRHIGFSPVVWTNGFPLFVGMNPGESFYFDHAYHAEPLDAAVIGARARHTVEFSAAVQQGALFGVEFLPEESGDAGMKALAAFVQF